jgi:hypothetical protein
VVRPLWHAVVSRLARTLGFRIASVNFPSRKCACRRELNSHDVAKPQNLQPATSAWRETVNHVARGNSLISARASVSAGRSKRMTKPPEAATGSSVESYASVAAIEKWKENTERSRASFLSPRRKR